MPLYNPSASSLTAVNAQTTNYTLTNSDQTVTFDPGAGNLNATLPTAVGISGKIFTIKNIGVTSTGTVTILTTSSQFCESRPSGDIVLTASGYDYITVQSDGTNYVILDKKETAYVSSTSNTIAFSTIGSNNYGALTSNSITLGAGQWRVHGYFYVYTGGSVNTLLTSNSGFYAANGANTGSAPTALSGAIAGATTFQAEGTAGFGLGDGNVATTIVISTATVSFTVAKTSSQTIYLVPQVLVSSAGTSALTAVLWAERIW